MHLQEEPPRPSHTAAAADALAVPFQSCAQLSSSWLRLEACGQQPRPSTCSCGHCSFSASCTVLPAGQASSSNLGDTAVISTAGSYSPSTSRLNLVSGQHSTTSALGGAGRRNSVQVGCTSCCHQQVARLPPVDSAGLSTCHARLAWRRNSVQVGHPLCSELAWLSGC